MNIVVLIILFTIAYIVINFIIACICNYLDTRYEITGVVGEFPLGIALTFAWFWAIIVIFEFLKKKEVPFSLSNVLKKIQDKAALERKKALDIDYQAEKYLLDKTDE